MKKFLIGLLMAAFTFSSFNADAQSQTLKTKTITAADTLTVLNIGSNVVSIQATAIKDSLTMAGKVYLEVTNDASGAWFKVDSVTLADNTNKQGLKKDFTVTSFTHARFICTNTTPSRIKVRYVITRRTDENK